MSVPDRDLVAEALAQREKLWDKGVLDYLSRSSPIVAAARAWLEQGNAIIIQRDGAVERAAKIMRGQGWTCTAHEPEPCSICDESTEKLMDDCVRCSLRGGRPTVSLYCFGSGRLAHTTEAALDLRPATVADLVEALKAEGAGIVEIEHDEWGDLIQPHQDAGRYLVFRLEDTQL